MTAIWHVTGNERGQCRHWFDRELACRHEMLNEINSDEVVSNLLGWISSQLEEEVGVP